MSGYHIVPLAKQSSEGFSCGSAPLDRYFREQVTQDIRRRIAPCIVAIAANSEEIAGYYTLAATSLAFDQHAPERAKKPPRYPVVPAILLGRLAVAIAHQGIQLGSSLVAYALLRSTRTEVVGHLMIVDAKDGAAVRFYDRLGFERLIDDPSRLIRALSREKSLISYAHLRQTIWPNFQSEILNFRTINWLARDLGKPLALIIYRLLSRRCPLID